MSLDRRRLVLLQWLALTALVMILSLISTALWGGREEEPPGTEVIIREGMTVAEFGEVNDLPNPALRELFDLSGPGDLERPLAGFGLDAEDLSARAAGAMALQAEHESRNWVKIAVKFALWAAFLLAVFVLMRRGKVTPALRWRLYLGSVLLFGVVLGSDLSPMGTVKDAIALFASKGVVFPPRMIALGGFLAMVVLANKFICSWGCQLGALQDFIFRLGRRPADRRWTAFRQVKVSFAAGNGVRAGFLALFTLAAFTRGTDIIEGIDAFKIFNPAALGFLGVMFVVGVLMASIFVYRPWCHFICPFGLVGWVFEKLSIFRIKVDYGRCTACLACEKACPSTVMSGILRREGVIPDCYSCGTCINVCPADAVSFGAGKRSRPPDGKFRGGSTTKEVGP